MMHLFDGIHSRIAGLESGGRISLEVRRSPEPFRDMTLFCAGEARQAALVQEEVAALPEIAEAARSGTKVSLRFTDEAILEAGATIASGDLGLTTNAAGGDPIFVGFLGPNLSKALHIGHLRNIVLGNACTGLFRTTGHPTFSYSLIGDIGRNVCEAMAGWELLEPDTNPELGGVKSDHLVGICYRRFLEATAASPGSGADNDPCRREHVPAGDGADRLLHLWRRGDPATIALWKRVCGLVETGHAETLDRLGISVDRSWRESRHIDEAVALVDRGLTQGHFGRDATGMTFFDTGLEQYPRLIVARADGFPTEHARVLAVFDRVLSDAGRCHHLDWNGTEWEPAQRAIAKLMPRLGLGAAGSRHSPQFHGMVTGDGVELSSSEGQPQLIDELLDRLARSPQIERLGTLFEDSPARDGLAAFVLKSFFLCAPPTKPLAYSWEHLMDPKANPGWSLARAWARTCRIHPGQDQLAMGDYRTAVLQAASLRHEFDFAVRHIRLTGLVSFVVKYSDRLLPSDGCHRLDSVAHTVLRVCLTALGILPLSRSENP